MPRGGRQRKKTFDELVRKAGPDECWEWQGHRFPFGYGMFYLGRVDGKVKNVSAHRIAWERANRPLHPDELVLHKCDNPPCVNPAHLWIGDYQDNMRDAKKKGRMSHYMQPGEKHLNAKLTESDVWAIRALAQQKTSRELAEQFGVAQSHISDIIARRRWCHLA